MSVVSLRDMPTINKGMEARSGDGRPRRLGVRRINVTSAKIARTIAPRVHTSRSTDVLKEGSRNKRYTGREASSRLAASQASRTTAAMKVSYGAP